MELTKDNLPQWKAELRKQMKEQYDLDAFDETLFDDEWLKNYEGETPEYAIECEVECWEP